MTLCLPGASRQVPASLVRFPYPKLRAGKYSVANIKSQIKRNKTNEKARLRNKAAKSEIKTRLRNAVVAAESGAEEAAEELQIAFKHLDKAASKGIIHKNQAANRKSALAKRVNAINAQVD